MTTASSAMMGSAAHFLAQEAVRHDGIARVPQPGERQIPQGFPNGGAYGPAPASTATAVAMPNAVARFVRQ